MIKFSKTVKLLINFSIHYTTTGLFCLFISTTCTSERKPLHFIIYPQDYTYLSTQSVFIYAHFFRSHINIHQLNEYETSKQSRKKQYQRLNCHTLANKICCGDCHCCRICPVCRQISFKEEMNEPKIEKQKKVLVGA